MRLQIHLVLLVVLLSLGTFSAAENSNSRNERSVQSISNGFTLASHLADYLATRQFNNAMSSIVKTVGPYVHAISPFVTLLQGPANSAELHAVRTLARNAETHLERATNQIHTLTTSIHSIAVRMNEYESKINHAFHNYRNLISTNSFNAAKSSFIAGYESNYHNSGIKLFSSIADSLVFGDDLFTTIMKATNYDTTKTQTCMLQSFGLLLKAATVELTYHSLKHHPAIPDYANQWISRLNNVRTKMEQENGILASHHGR